MVDCSPPNDDKLLAENMPAVPKNCHVHLMVKHEYSEFGDSNTTSDHEHGYNSQSMTKRIFCCSCVCTRGNFRRNGYFELGVYGCGVLFIGVCLIFAQFFLFGNDRISVKAFNFIFNQMVISFRVLGQD